MESRRRQVLRSLIQSAKKIRTDQTIPKDLKEAFLALNGTLVAELRKYDEALEFLRGADHCYETLLFKRCRGMVTEKKYLEYLAKIRRARQQVYGTELFARELSETVQRTKGGKNLSSQP